MDRQEQETFVRNLTERVAEGVIHHIKTGKIPDTWDGHELRVLLAKCFDNEITSHMRQPRSRQRKDCENEILVNNLDRLPS